MPRSHAPVSAQVSGAGKVTLNVLPDPFDARDLPYRPRITPLDPVLDQRDDRHVMRQTGNSCVGHALAAMINHVTRSRVSPYMLYYLARRYDEFEGEEDVGSSLRGGLKGWFHHGVCSDALWPRLRTAPRFTDETFLRDCVQRPLGAFYRADTHSLDDLQSAISELNAVVASAAIHEGWTSPVVLTDGDVQMHVIARRRRDREIGGHAFTLVGYNSVGFLVQNSWGVDWGKGGFATLPYEDWLNTGWDAWVARPGVPSTPFASGATQRQVMPGTGIAVTVGPDPKRLRPYVVNLGNNGRLSRRGRFTSDERQVAEVIDEAARQHAEWTDGDESVARHIVLYAHGGLVQETAGLNTAQKHLDLWRGHHIYPINFVWQSGALESLEGHLVDLVRGRLPAGGLRERIAEAADRMVEAAARRAIRWIWREMKQNARAASDPLAAAPRDDLPGGSLVALHLKRYVARYPNTRIHLVGHSAGSIFHAALLPRLLADDVPVESVTFLAPAIRVDEFDTAVLGRLGESATRLGRAATRFTSFLLTDAQELADNVGRGAIVPYGKSLLYLVARALEPAIDDSLGGVTAARSNDSFEVPLLGMERFLDARLRKRILDAGGDIVFSGENVPPRSVCEAVTHGGFDDDNATMLSVVHRTLGRRAMDTGGLVAIRTAPVAGTRIHAAQPSAVPAAALGDEVPLLPMLAARGWQPVRELPAEAPPRQSPRRKQPKNRTKRSGR